MAHPTTTFQHGVEGVGAFEDLNAEEETTKTTPPIPRLLAQYERETTPTLNPAASWREQIISQEHHPLSGDEDSVDTKICCEEATGATEGPAIFTGAKRE